MTPMIISLMAVLKRDVGLLHHLSFNTKIEDPCETPRCPQAQGQDFPVCALWLGAAVGLDTPPRLNACMDWGKGGGAPRCASSNSFLPPQNKEGLLIPSTGRSVGWELQLYSLPAGRGFPRPVVWFCAGGSSKSSSVEGSLVAAPSPLWLGHDWVLLSQIPSLEQCYWGKGSHSLGQPCGRALLPAFQQFLSWL